MPSKQISTARILDRKQQSTAQYTCYQVTAYKLHNIPWTQGLYRVPVHKDFETNKTFGQKKVNRWASIG